MIQFIKERKIKQNDSDILRTFHCLRTSDKNVDVYLDNREMLFFFEEKNSHVLCNTELQIPNKRNPSTESTRRNPKEFYKTLIPM